MTHINSNKCLGVGLISRVVVLLKTQFSTQFRTHTHTQEYIDHTQERETIRSVSEKVLILESLDKH